MPQPCTDRTRKVACRLPPNCCRTDNEKQKEHNKGGQTDEPPWGGFPTRAFTFLVWAFLLQPDGTSADGLGENTQAPQKPGVCCHLPVLVSLMHHGSLGAAIVGVLGRKHGASASPRLAGISRRPNVWWPKVEQKNSFFGFVL